MELEFILAENVLFNLDIYGSFFCIVGYGVCVISSSYSFQWTIMKPCILLIDILRMCMWVFDEARINFDRITAF